MTRGVGDLSPSTRPRFKFFHCFTILKKLRRVRKWKTSVTKSTQIHLILQTGFSLFTTIRVADQMLKQQQESTTILNSKTVNGLVRVGSCYTSITANIITTIDRGKRSDSHQPTVARATRQPSTDHGKLSDSRGTTIASSPRQPSTDHGKRLGRVDRPRQTTRVSTTAVYPPWPATRSRRRHRPPSASCRSCRRSRRAPTLSAWRTPRTWWTRRGHPGTPSPRRRRSSESLRTFINPHIIIQTDRQTTAHEGIDTMLD